MAKLRAAIVGATGLAGQQFVVALDDHPWIEVGGLAASERSAGKTYADALRTANGMLAWFVQERLPPRVASMKVAAGSEVRASDFDLVFSAVEADVARELEPRFARDVPVVSTASAFRYEEDVPLLIPPVNARHAALLHEQRKRRGTKGYVVPIPNCTVTGLVITLAPLEEAFGVQSVLMTSLQAMSGAGRSPGVIGLDILDNVIPYIVKEEGKVEVEARKILGSLGQGAIAPHPMKVSCTCTRVAGVGGHNATGVVGLKRKDNKQEGE